LNTATGALTFINSPNFEAPGSAAGTNTYTVRVRASDAAGNTAVQTVTVNVTDLDEVVPVFTGGSTATASIAENTSTSTVVHTASATDNEGVTAYAFDGSGADNNRFSLNTATGALTFINSPNFEAPGSAAGTNTYTVRVRASDAAGNTAVQTVTVNVTDMDEVVPVFTAGANANASIAENTPTSTVVHTASATDNVGVTAYAFETGGADNNRFSLNTATGALTFLNSPNFEAPGSAAGTNTYTVRVRASDAAGNSAVQTVTVNVTDLDEVSPIFAAGPTATASIAENTPASTVVHTASATDNVGVTAYAFDGSGADNNRFSINAATGALRFLSSPNFEAPGSAAGTNTYTVRVRASDAAGNSAVQTVTVNVTDVDDTAPVFAAGASTNASIAENSLTSTVVHTATATDNVGVTAYAFEAGGADNARFSLNTSTGALTFLSRPDFEAPGSAAGTNAYTVRVRASDAAGNNAVQTVTINVTDVFDAPTTAQAFALWQEAELAWLGDSSKNINALNQYSAATMQHRDITSADGSANQADPAKRLSQYINQVTGTDIVSDAEFDAGFTITGKAAAGAQATIKFRLDKDRTTGVDGQGAQVLNLGANDVDNLDGDNNHATGTDVTATYNNATGDWSLAFAPGSGALLQATHNTHGSGVHQLVVDTDGNGSRTGSGASAEASRLFLVASGTASSSHTGLVSQNFSVQDKLTNDVFVYYFGDPDGAGVGLWTALDNGDSASNTGLVSIDKDNDSGISDWDFYNNPTAHANAATTPATASNTALHLVTNIGAQTWEFHMGTNSSLGNWITSYAIATDHGFWGSNTSRQASLAEAIALYAANFGGNNAGGNTVGGVQPMSNVGSINGSFDNEVNRPGGWSDNVWTAAPTPSGNAQVYFYHGNIGDNPLSTVIPHAVVM
jgi:hypothetical protein